LYCPEKPQFGLNIADPYPTKGFGYAEPYAKKRVWTKMPNEFNTPQNNLQQFVLLIGTHYIVFPRFLNLLQIEF
jgi:hypothetical protein